MAKNQIWFEVEEHETVEQCLERIKKGGYTPIGRKEEPVFHVVNDEPIYLKQKICFKGQKLE